MPDTPSELTPETLQTESAALHRLAHSLLDDPHAAEDVVQEAWLATLRRPPRRTLSGWLSVVGHNLARRHHRSEGRRGQRERDAAQPEALPSTVDAIARVEIHQRVVKAVLALDEPYRTTVVLRYWEDMPPRHIAMGMNVPVATVRTRLRRANELLREKLDRSCGDRAAWATPLARWIAPSGAAALGSSPLLLGWIVMGMKTKIALLSALSLALLWVAVDSVAFGESAVPEPAFTLAQGVTLDEEPKALVEAESEAESRTLVELPAVEPGAGFFKVRVLDQHGEPAAGVDLSCETEAGKAKRGWGMGKTDADGLLEWDGSRQFASAPDASWTAYAVITGGRCSDKPFIPSELGREPLTLQLPPTGTLTMHVIDLDGVPIDGRYLGPQATVSASPLPKSLHGIPPAEIPEQALVNLHGRIELNLNHNGKAHFAHALLGTQLVLKFSWHQAEIHAGPSSLLPDTVIEYRVGSASTLTGRLLGVGGHPLKNQLFRYALRHRRGSSNNTASTDENGRFRLLMGSARANTQIGSKPHITIKEGDHRVGGGQPSAGFQVDRAMTTGTNELGDVQLIEAPLIVSGHLVAHGISLQRTLPIYLEHKDNHWAQLVNHSSKNLDDGRFEFRGHVPDGPLRLQVHSGAWLPVEPVEFSKGATNLELELVAAGSLRASFLLDDGPWRQLRLRLETQDGSQAYGDTRGRLMRIRHTLQALHNRGQATGYTWKGLAPRSYRLRVEVPGPGRALIDLQNIVVPTAGLPDDPRLENLDLRGLRSIAIEVRDPSGNPYRSRAGGILIVSANQPWLVFDLEDGNVRVPIIDPIDLWVFAPGYRSQLLEGVNVNTTARLKTAPEIRFQVTGPLRLPAGMQMLITLRGPRGAMKARTVADGMMDNWPARTRLGAGEVTLTMSPAGDATHLVRFPREVTLSLRLHAGEKSTWVSCEPRNLDLASLPPGETVPISFTAEALQAAITKLNR